MFLTEKYRPKSLEEFIGNPEIVSYAKNWAKKWQQNQKQKPLLFYGKPGIGKTSLAYALANSHNWQVFELNASDVRNKRSMEETVLPAAMNTGLFGKKLILIDEVDSLAKADKGFLSSLEKLIQNTNNPIIFTANKIYTKSKSLAFLQKLTTVLEFKNIKKSEIVSFLKKICEAEKIDYDLVALNALANSCGSDVRAALLDLQAITLKPKKITLEDVSSLHFREREQKIFLLLNKIFKTKELSAIRDLRRAVDIDYNMLKHWIEENLPNAYNNADLPKSFNMLSKADVFDGRILRRQYYGFLRYCYEFITSGIALTKTKPKHGWLKLQFPRVLKLRPKPSEKAIELAERFSLRFKKFLLRDFPYLKFYYK